MPSKIQLSQMPCSRIVQAPIIVAFLAAAFLGEKVTGRLITAISVASAGLWILLDGFSMSPATGLWHCGRTFFRPFLCRNNRTIQNIRQAFLPCRPLFFGQHIYCGDAFALYKSISPSMHGGVF